MNMSDGILSLVSMAGGALIGMKTMFYTLDRGKSPLECFLAVFFAGSIWAGFIFIIAVGLAQ